MADKKICFVICPIGSIGSSKRKWSDQTFKYIISPIVEKYGYKAVRADHIKESGMITSQIIDLLIESPLIIADLTDHNPNVFYELAIRHAIQKPYIQMIKQNQEIPFDISGMRTILFDLDLDIVENAKNELNEQMQSIDKKFTASNPITMSRNNRIIQNMLKEDTKIKNDNLTIAVFESLREMRLNISELKQNFSAIKNSSPNYVNNVNDETAVNGRVIIKKKNIGLGGAYVSLIDPDTNINLYDTTSDANGYYTIKNIKNVNDGRSYKLYAKLSPFGEGYSDVFSVTQGKNISIDIKIDSNLEI